MCETEYGTYQTPQPERWKYPRPSGERACREELNKIALVTGGTSGIGLATAKLLAAEGAKVFVTGRRSPELAAAIEQIGQGAVGIQGDVSKLEDLDRLFTAVTEQAGRLDILFANAGTAEHLTIEQVSESRFEAGFSANVKGVFFCMQKALPLMPNGAAVVLNASMWTIKGIRGFGVLSAGKAALRSFARTWANEFRERRIRINVVSPGPVHTPSIEKATGGRDNAERLLSQLSKDIPLGRPGTPDEIAKAVLFRASEDASYVNGAELFVDGGMVQI